jgi:hypothetical protein
VPKNTEEEIQKQVRETLENFRKSSKSKRQDQRRDKRYHEKWRLKSRKMQKLKRTRLQFSNIGDLYYMMDTRIIVIGACMSLGMMMVTMNRLDAGNNDHCCRRVRI